MKIVFETKYGSLSNSNCHKEFLRPFLPLMLTLSEYAGVEKYSKFLKPLNIKDELVGTDGKIGNISYFAPCGNLYDLLLKRSAIF